MADESAPSASTPLLKSDVKDERYTSSDRLAQRWFRWLLRPCAGEFVATAMFVFVGTTSVCSENNLLIGFAHGLTIALLVVTFSDISGAHVNPVATLGLLLGSSSLHWLQAIFYVISQLVGAILGAALTRGVLSYTPSNSTQAAVNTTVYQHIRGGSHTLAQGVSPGQGVLCEATTTFLLILTILLAVDSRTSQRRLAPFAIGLAVFAGVAISAGVTGGSLNPARSFGPAVVISDIDIGVWTHHYVYWAGPVIGSLIAVCFYRLMFASSARRVYGAETSASSATDQLST